MNWWKLAVLCDTINEFKQKEKRKFLSKGAICHCFSFFFFFHCKPSPPSATGKKSTFGRREKTQMAPIKPQCV